MKRNIVRKDDRVQATPETLAKLMPDWAFDLSPLQLEALHLIRAGYDQITAETRVRESSPVRGDKAYAEETPRQQQIEVNYYKWLVRCSGKKWQFLKVHPVIVDRESTMEQAAPILGNIHKCLDEYLRLLGLFVVDAVHDN